MQVATHKSEAASNNQKDKVFLANSYHITDLVLDRDIHNTLSHTS